MVGDFLQIDDEVVRVTVIIGMGSYTVTRGVLGTDALVSHVYQRCGHEITAGGRPDDCAPNLGI